MGHSLKEEVSKYSHSPVHHAVASKDYVALRRIINSLPKLAKTGDVKTEADSIAEETKAGALSAVLDRRDVPGKETALHLAVRLGDATAAEILMDAGIDWSLQNEQGWSALQEAICLREEAIAMVIMRYYHPTAWAKWCRRVPRVVATMQRMRDFYMELTFHFESSVIPFIGRIAPSDTYRIWKRGSNLRADMTLAGFDGFKIQRSDQSFIFLGEGSADGKLPAGSLCIMNHKKREIMNALEGGGAQLTDAQIAQEVATMSETNMYRPGIDVTQADLIPQMTWRRQEKSEMVGRWKAKLYDMHNVMVSIKSRRVPGAMTDEELFGGIDAEREDRDLEDFAHLLTEEEKRQLEIALKMDNAEMDDNLCCSGKSHLGINISGSDVCRHSQSNASVLGGLDQNIEHKEEKKGWLDWSRRSFKQDGSKKMGPRSSLSIEGKVSDLLGDDSGRKDGVPKSSKHHSVQRPINRRLSDFKPDDSYLYRKDRDIRKIPSRDHMKKSRVTPSSDSSCENEYRKGVRPVLWLTSDFPLKVEELLPLLDILADKVKAVRRLRELLTTKLPTGTFPVKVAIPVVPTIRVIVTFSKFEELSPVDIFATPLSSPAHWNDPDVKEQNDGVQNSSSWFSWIKGSGSRTKIFGPEQHTEDSIDPFAIPTDYTWTSMSSKKHKMNTTKSKKKNEDIRQ